MPANADLQRRRAGAIERLRLIDRAGDPGLVGLARVAAFVTGADAAAVHIVDELYQRRIAAVNAPLGDHPRDDAMCSLVVDTGLAIICEDASGDPRFAYSSFVRGEQPIRFYASVPLTTGDGIAVGTLCAFDIVPRTITDDQLTAFEDLAAQAIAHVELTRLAVDLGHAASHDPLTGLANRLLLADRLEHALARRRRHGGNVLVIIVDLDEFKTLNDSHGHHAGDTMLAEVAGRLRQAAREEDTVARTGGDEFAVVAEDIAGQDDALGLVRRLEQALVAPVEIAGRPHPLAVSLGFAFAADGDDPSRLLARADAAMYARKGA